MVSWWWMRFATYLAPLTSLTSSALALLLAHSVPPCWHQVQSCLRAFVLGVSLCLEGFSSRSHKPCDLTSSMSLLKFHLFSEDFYTFCLNHHQPPLRSLPIKMHFPYPLASAFSDHLSLSNIIIYFIYLSYCCLIRNQERRDFSFFFFFFLFFTDYQHLEQCLEFGTHSKNVELMKKWTLDRRYILLWYTIFSDDVFIFILKHIFKIMTTIFGTQRKFILCTTPKYRN